MDPSRGHELATPAADRVDDVADRSTIHWKPGGSEPAYKRPNPDETDQLNGHPRLYMLGFETIRRLEQHLNPGETYDAGLNRVLDAATRRRTVEGFVRTLLQQRGTENINRVVIPKNSLTAFHPRVFVEVAEESTTPPVVDDTDALLLLGRQVEFTYCELPVPLNRGELVTVYDAGADDKASPITVDDGMATVRSIARETLAAEADDSERVDE